MQVLKAFSALLCYPSPELRDAMGDITLLLTSDPALDDTAIIALGPLTKALATEDLFDLQAAYVDLFDRGRRLSLHLFEHVHGESRDRGQAMVDLAQVYERGGLSWRRVNCRTICRRSWSSPPPGPMPRRCRCWAKSCRS